MMISEEARATVSPMVSMWKMAISNPDVALVVEDALT